jgi:hypothetical protein
MDEYGDMEQKGIWMMVKWMVRDGGRERELLD